jgi:uncharacterized protein (TIGR02328 family)
LRGKGWGRKHSTIDYVFNYSIRMLEDYHFLVMLEMERRGYKPSFEWWMRGYRGKSFGIQVLDEFIKPSEGLIYPEHDEAYLAECVKNLYSKGVVIDGVAEGARE